MKSFYFALFLFLVGAESFASSQGVIGSGGGRGVLCTSGTVESLDLFEARELYGQTLLPTLSNLDAEMNRLAKRIADLNHLDVLGVKKHFENTIQSRVRFLSAGSRLMEIPDSLEILSRDGCRSVQVAAYQVGGTILIDRDYWNRMDVKSQAALLLHETVYKQARDRGHTNSVLARRVTGSLFSTYALQPISHLTNPKPGELTCLSADQQYEFEVSDECRKTEDSQLCIARLKFSTFAGVPIHFHVGVVMIDVSKNEFITASERSRTVGGFLEKPLGDPDSMVQIRFGLDRQRAGGFISVDHLRGASEAESAFSCVQH